MEIKTAILRRAALAAGFAFAYAATVAALDAPDLIRLADDAYAQRTDPAFAGLALETYEQAIAADSVSPEAAWKAARAAWWVGEFSETKKFKTQFFQQGINFAKTALERDPDCAEAHFWLGVNYGSFGETRGVLKSLFLVKPIREAMENVLRLNEQIAGGGAHRVLGVVDYKVPGFAGGNRRRSLERLQKAKEIDPSDPFNLYYLAEYYATIGQVEKAKAAIADLEAAPVPDHLAPEWELTKTKADALSRRWK